MQCNLNSNLIDFDTEPQLTEGANGGTQFSVN